jgi:hypothetical protein
MTRDTPADHPPTDLWIVAQNRSQPIIPARLLEDQQRCPFVAERLAAAATTEHLLKLVITFTQVVQRRGDADDPTQFLFPWITGQPHCRQLYGGCRIEHLIGRLQHVLQVTR